MIKGIALSGGNSKFADFRFYNFSGLKGQTKVSRKGLHFYSSRVTLVFSCLNKEFTDYFLHNLFELPEIEVGNLSLIPETVEQENPIQLQDEVKFVCISPLVLLSPKFNDNSAKKFISPEGDQFSDVLYESTMARMEEMGQYTSEEISKFYKFQLVPDKRYLIKILESQKKFARIYPVFDQDVKYEIRGYTFPFTLYASHEVQEFIFNCGLGAFTHKGFGMLDIAHTDPNQRAKKYEFSYA